jgi:hypothetical protein
MRTKNKLVYGVGVNDLNQHIRVGGENIHLYRCWTAMLKRCYDVKYQTTHPTYIGCSVSEEWKYLSNFKKWYDANYREGLELDKDILVKSNKVYSADTCCFVPHYINMILIDNINTRGNLPLGVCAQTPSTKSRRINTTYMSSCNDGYGKYICKTLKTVEDAVVHYRTTKKSIIAHHTNRALEEGAISQRVADALLSRDF